jgi:hypothetical protein
MDTGGLFPIGRATGQEADQIQTKYTLYAYDGNPCNFKVTIIPVSTTFFDAFFTVVQRA